MIPRAVASLVLLLGCGASEAAPVEAPVVTSEPASATHPTPTDAEAASRGLSASVDPAQGLVVVARLEDASDGEAPPMIVSGHRCAQQEIDAVAAMLSDYVSERRAMEAPLEWTCAGDRCELRGMMEFDPTRALRFGRNAAGGLVVIGVDFFEDVGSGPEYVAQVRASVDADHAALLARCP